MSGIAGEVTLAAGARKEIRGVLRMAHSLPGRTSGSTDLWDGDWAVLAHRGNRPEGRDGPDQPLVRGHVAVVLDGHLHNAPDVRQELERFHRFESGTDAEVVLLAYRRWGEEFIEHLRGAFALVVVDRREHKVLLATDALGNRPLHVAWARGRLRFASTLPALLAGGGINTELDPVALQHHLSRDCVVWAPRTIVAGVRKLPAATLRVIEAGRTRDRTYWTPAAPDPAAHEDWTHRDWVEATHDALAAAVARRADHHTAVLLSGGLASSLMVALLSGHSAAPATTFSIGFDGAANEFLYSNSVARTYATHHHRIHVDGSDLADVVADTVAEMPEPMCVRDATLTHLLLRAIGGRSSATTVLSGEGACDVFNGGATRVTGLLDGTAVRPSAHLFDDVAARVDGASRARGLDVRLPFLDEDVARLVSAHASLPPGAQGERGLLAQLGRQLLPICIINRSAADFPLPALVELRGPLLDLVTDVLRSPEARMRRILNPERLEAMLASPPDAHAASRNRLLQLAVLELWLQNHGLTDEAEPQLERIGS